MHVMTHVHTHMHIGTNAHTINKKVKSNHVNRLEFIALILRGAV